MPARFQKQVLNFILVVSVLCFVPLRHVRIVVSPPLSSFPGSEAAFYHQFNDLFNAEADQNIIFIALSNRRGVFEKIFLQKAADLTTYITSLPQVRQVYAVTNSNVIYFNGSEVGARPLVNISRQETYVADSIYLFQSPEYRNLLVSLDGRYIAVAVFYKQGTSQAQGFALLKSIEEKTASLKFDDSYIVSPLGTEKDFLNSGPKEFTAFALACIMLLVVLSAVIFKNAKPALAITALTVLSLLWTASAMAVMNIPAQPIHIFLPLVLIVAAIIQVTGAARLNLWGRASPYKSIFLLTAAMTGACASLCFSAWPPTRQFGLSSAVGVATNGILASALLPVLLPTTVYIRKFAFSDAHRWRFDWRKFSCNSLTVSFWLIIFSTACVFYCTPQKQALWWSDHAPVHSAAQKNMAFVDDQFSGLLPFELSVEAGNAPHSFFEVSMMEKMAEIETYLEDSCAVGALISPLSFFRAANKAFSGGGVVYYKLPQQEYVPQLYGAIMQSEHGDEMNRYMNEAGTRARISGRVRLAAGADYTMIGAKLKAWLHQERLDQLFVCRITGPLTIKADSVTYAVQDTWRTLLIIFLLAMAFQLKSSRSLPLVFSALGAALTPPLVMLAATALLHLRVDVYLPVLCVLVSFVSGAGTWLNNAASAVAGANSTRLTAVSVSLISLLIISLLFFSNLPVLVESGIALLFGVAAAMLVHILLLFTARISAVENLQYETEVNHPSV